MIALFTDFGDDVYVGQMKAAILAVHPAATIVDVLHRVPSFAIGPGAQLLAALAPRFARGTVFVAVVDPGVGTDRDAAVVHADGRWLVGPDNGLLSVVAARASDCTTWRIAWTPPSLSASFHGRDLFAPIGGWIDRGEVPHDKLQRTARLRVCLDTSDLHRVIYVDHYGNAMTGVRAQGVDRRASLAVRRCRLAFVRTFADAPPGIAFWYENSLGLVEIAANRARAADLLQIHVGDAVEISTAA